MTKRIRSYNDLLNEKQKLETLLDAQKELIRLEVDEVENKIFPAINMVNAVGRFATYNTRAFLLTTFSDILIDLVADATGLKNKNWVGRVAIPGAMKNFSSHLIAKNKDQIMSVLSSLIDLIFESFSSEPSDEEEAAMQSDGPEEPQEAMQ